MRLRYSGHFMRRYEKAPASVRKAFDRRAGFLLENLQHPSLRAKKYDESRGVWQARVNRDWRFYFSIAGDVYHLHDIVPHP